MIGKRFEVDVDHLLLVWDTEENKRLEIEDIVDLLNTQQDTNDYLEESNSRLQVQLGKTLRLVDEQQATIDQLNLAIEDLLSHTSCDEIKKENEQLRKINKQLREINKELGDDLHNCRLNKNIIREKLKLWQDVHKEYNIYNIKDFEELMKSIK